MGESQPHFRKNPNRRAFEAAVDLEEEEDDDENTDDDGGDSECDSYALRLGIERGRTRVCGRPARTGRGVCVLVVRLGR